MIKEVKIKSTHEPYLYAGTHDISDEGKIIDVILENSVVSIDINKFFNSESSVLNELSIADLKRVCNVCQIKITIFPNGNHFFQKLDSSKDELKSCYLATFKDQNSNDIFVVIAFDETQPALYKAKLLAVFEYN